MFQSEVTLFSRGEIFARIVRAREIWSHRLTVRTPGFHPGNPGSIPGEITKVKYPSFDGYFTLTLLIWGIK
jgi:hypothetical protein